MDMRFGRNVTRTIFEYYRFTNVLTIPLMTEINPRKGRPKTHRPRGRSRVKQEVKLRPKTTRVNAPISYTDLSIRYDSESSNDGSPIRYGQYGYGFGTRSSGNIYMNMNHDQFSLLAIQSSKFNNLDFSNDFKGPALPKIHATITSTVNLTKNGNETLNIPPKPCLSIIDFNQLTRGGLEQATKKFNEEKKNRPKQH
ncbi:hypothetical protein Bhyg_16281 [Pseudolycoriella hygida]|uniref:Uncharacterized protein n=1 Tax=Pseudolycoriella hygida TaxID=35572 RepID=A0A9Q0RTJ8_9DIPT|nr:hypothetical protein Bhyg_16281 [Pseudolycoriella hygida]